MPDTSIVRYEKAHDSLSRGMITLAERTKTMDLAKPGVEFEIQKLVVSAQEARDIAKDRRDREAAPFTEPLTEIKERWKPLIDGFDTLFKHLKMMGGEVLRRQREEAEKRRQEAEAILEDARRKERERSAAEAQKATADEAQKAREASLVTLREAREAVDALPPAGAPIGVKTDMGTLSGREVWKWEVVDIDQVPNAYCQRMVEGQKVDMAVKNGSRTIPGIRIWSDVEMASRRPSKARR